MLVLYYKVRVLCNIGSNFFTLFIFLKTCSNRAWTNLITFLKWYYLNFIQLDYDHQLASNWYIFSQVLGQYFSKLMHKQKNTQRVSIYWKWETLLPNIRCKNEVANIFPLPTFPYNEGSIVNIIKILWKIAKRLGLSDKIIRNKVILLKGNLLIF